MASPHRREELRTSSFSETLCLKENSRQQTVPKIISMFNVSHRQKYSKTSLIRTNWERTLVQISESPNYRSATENMLREVIKWTSLFFLGNTTLFWNLDCIS
jgi:hypothetical protein